MNKKVKRLLSIILCSALMTTSVGCSSKEKESKMGRYVEERYDIGLESYVQNIIELEDGRLSMVGAKYEEYAPKYTKLISEDGGKNWTEQSINPPTEDGKTTYINSMCQFTDGRILIGYYFEKPWDEQSIEEMNQEDYVYEEPEFKYGIIDESGNFEEAKMDLSNDLDNPNGGYIDNFKAADNGDIFYVAGENSNELVQIDGETYEEKDRYVSDDYIENYLLMGNDIILVSWAGIVKYDMESGKETGNLEALEKETINSTGNYYPTIISTNSKDKIYYYSVLGLSVYDMKTEKTKMLVDGSISSFGDNSMALVGLVEKENDDFLAIFNDWSSQKDSICAINYSYDKNIPTVPDNQIIVYSLIENDAVRQAISAYTKTHQDTYIKYEVGLTWDSGVTESDALKTLNTEIMGGKGPDILLLDGISYDSYIEKGLLEDLSDVVETYLKNDEIFSSIVDAYTVDGKIYEIPTKFTIPMLAGKKDEIDKITDLKSLTEVAQELVKKNDNKIFTNYFGTRNLVYSLYYLYGNDWLNKDNTINEEALTEFMNNTKELYTAVATQQEKYDKKMDEIWNDRVDIDDGVVKLPEEDIDEEFDEEEYEGEAYDEDTMNAYELNYSLIPYAYFNGFLYDEYPSNLAFGGINNIYEYTSLITTMYADKNFDYKILTRGEDRIFYPISKYGINSNSKNKDTAKDFIKVLLSENVQGNNTGWSEGLPVNKVAFKNMFKLTDEYGDYYKFDETSNHYISEEYTMSMNNIEKKMVDVWPNDDDVNRFIGEIEKSNVAPTLNKVLLLEVAKQFDVFVNGEQSVDDAVAKVVDKLDLYLAE